MKTTRINLSKTLFPLLALMPFTGFAETVTITYTGVSNGASYSDPNAPIYANTYGNPSYGSGGYVGAASLDGIGRTVTGTIVYNTSDLFYAGTSSGSSTTDAQYSSTSVTLTPISWTETWTTSGGPFTLTFTGNASGTLDLVRSTGSGGDVAYLDTFGTQYQSPYYSYSYLSVNFHSQTINQSDPSLSSDPANTGATISHYFVAGDLARSNQYAFDSVNLTSLSISTSGSAVPEPGTVILFGAGLAGLVWFRVRNGKTTAGARK